MWVNASPKRVRLVLCGAVRNRGGHSNREFRGPMIKYCSVSKARSVFVIGIREQHSATGERT